MFIKQNTITNLMELKALKQEIHDLPNIDDHLKDLQNNWLSPFLSKTNRSKLKDKRSPRHAINSLTKEEQVELNGLLNKFYAVFNQLKYGQFTNHKLEALAKAMVDLKLLQFQSENYEMPLHKDNAVSSKFHYISSQVLGDDFNSIHNTIKEVKEFDSQLLNAEEIYTEVNQYLYQKLPLEHSINLMDMGHSDSLRHLKIANLRRKMLIKKLGKNFVALQAPLRGRKKTFTVKDLDLIHD